MISRHQSISIEAGGFGGFVDGNGLLFPFRSSITRITCVRIEAPLGVCEVGRCRMEEGEQKPSLILLSTHTFFRRRGWLDPEKFLQLMLKR